MPTGVQLSESRSRGLHAPDLLHAGSDGASLDRELLQDVLELAFLGSNQSANIDEAFGRTTSAPTGWKADLYAPDLFLDSLAGSFAAITVRGRTYRPHTAFFRRVVSQPPTDPETIQARQAVLRELEGDPKLRQRFEVLYADIVSLLDGIKASYRSGDDRVPERVRILRQARDVIKGMESDFADATSWLGRLSRIGSELTGTEEYRTLEALLDWESSRARVQLDLRIGADGRVRDLIVAETTEDRGSPFYMSAARRWLTFAWMFWKGFAVTPAELVNRVVVATFKKLLPFLSCLFQLMCHMEVYLVSRAFASRLAERGLPTCLPKVVPQGRFRLFELSNPLLLEQVAEPVPCDLDLPSTRRLVLITGPNSGGKTRLLQAVGIAQLLGQSGLHAPAREAELPLASGCFASLVHRQTSDQVEGRLGTELIRIRSIFQEVEPDGLVLLDELCSGTNPSEAAEIIRMVLELLARLQPVAFITTHFLDMARNLQASDDIPELWFLRVDLNENGRPTYQFVPGVADTSLALGTAKRLGLDFDELAEILSSRVDSRRD